MLLDVRTSAADEGEEGGGGKAGKAVEDADGGGAEGQGPVAAQVEARVDHHGARGPAEEGARHAPGLKRSNRRREAELSYAREHLNEEAQLMELQEKHARIGQELQHTIQKLVII